MIELEFLSLQNWSHTEQEEELKRHAPVLYQVLKAATFNPRAEKRKSTNSTTNSGVVTAAGILLYSRNQFMNAHQTMTGMILKRGAAQKVVFKRLHARSMCVSYGTVLKKQVEYGTKHDTPVYEWKQQVEEETKRKKQLSALGDSKELKQLEKDQHPGFKLVGDNVDLRLKPRESTISEGNKDLHYYNVMAVKNRVPGNGLNDENPKGTLDSVPWSAYLPTAQDNEDLKTEWNYLVARTISNYIPHFQWFKELIPNHLDHQFIHLAKKKTEVVNFILYTISSFNCQNCLYIALPFSLYAEHQARRQ